MQHKNYNFLKGLGAGAVAGVALAAAIKCVADKDSRKSIGKTAGKTVRAMGNIAESLNYMLK